MNFLPLCYANTKLSTKLNVPLIFFQVAFYAFPNNEQEVRALANLNNRYHETSMANRNNDWEQGSAILNEDRIKEMWQVGE